MIFDVYKTSKDGYDLHNIPIHQADSQYNSILIYLPVWLQQPQSILNVDLNYWKVIEEQLIDTEKANKLLMLIPLSASHQGYWQEGIKKYIFPNNRKSVNTETV